ncbi:MAG: hypothetical protein EOP20_00840 [Hyphomicrobiales bacterium]|nr:MAG: hypothetical protein EOP20_00840 [Hyphomicrobiales bacterium]
MIDSVTRALDGGFIVVRDGQTLYVPDDSANTDRQAVQAWVAGGGKVSPYQPLATIVTLFPADLWRRASDGEAERIMAAIDAQPLRIRKIFETARSYQSDDELWPLLVNAATALFGPVRAKELLAPSA